MAKDKVKKAINYLARCLIESDINVSKIILFGSQSKGKATKESDVDVVIISDDFKGRDIFERAQLTKDAEIKTIKKFLIPFDIITMTQDEWEKGNFLIREFAKEGKVIYGWKT